MPPFPQPNHDHLQFHFFCGDGEAFVQARVYKTNSLVQAWAWSRRALALAVTTQVSRYCNSSFHILAVQSGCTSAIKSVLGTFLVDFRAFSSRKPALRTFSGTRLGALCGGARKKTASRRPPNPRNPLHLDSIDGRRDGRTAKKHSNVHYD